MTYICTVYVDIVSFFGSPIFIETSWKCGQGFHAFPVSITSFGSQKAQKNVGSTMTPQDFQKQLGTTAKKNAWGLELPFKAPNFTLEF